MLTFTFLACSLCQVGATKLAGSLTLFPIYRVVLAPALTLLFRQFCFSATRHLPFSFHSVTSQAQFPYWKNFIVPKYVHHSHWWFLLITSHILSQELCADFTMLQDQFFFPVYRSQATFHLLIPQVQLRCIEHVKSSPLLN